MIGDNIKRVRELKDLGLNELARMANMNASYLSAIEQNKKTNPSVKALEKIATALEVSSEEFLKPEPMSEEELKHYEDLYESNREEIPEVFTNASEAREYLSKHQTLVSKGFNLGKLSNEDVLDFANEILKQMDILSYKYKK